MNEKKYFILMIISLLAILLSFINLGFKITGKASDSSSINISIERTANINFTASSISFGFGKVDLGKSNATIDTLGNVTDGNWTPTYGGFRLENIGSSNLSLNLKADKNASSFLGGTGPNFLYSITNNESLSCNNGSFSLETWHEVNTSGDGTLICENFDFNDERDLINIEVRLVIPSDAFTGSRTSYFTATGTSI